MAHQRPFYAFPYLGRTMSVDVLIVTYPKDYEWLGWSMRALRRNLTGYRNIHVVIQGGEPGCDVPMIDGVIIHYGGKSPISGYIDQQAIKLAADGFTHADFIMHVDSDFFFKEKCDVSDFFMDGKPGWLWEYYSELGDTVPWQKPTEMAMGESVDREYMMAMPIIAHRTLYPLVRERLGNRHAGGWKGYLTERSNSGERFSEFNCMGHVAFTQQHDKYHWIHRNGDEWLNGHYRTRQFWSNAPISDHMPDIAAMVGDPVPEGLPIHCTEMGIWVVSHDTHFTKWVTQAKRLDHDRAFLGRILPYINPGDVVLDCGANIGTHTHAYAKAVAGVDTGRVVAFEPNPLPFECLKRNMLGHGHVQCINAGVGSAATEMGMEMSDNVGASHMKDGSGFKVMTIDSLRLYGCALIKMDIEGMEFAALQGAWWTISTYRPVLVLEMNPGALARNGVVPEDLYSWMRLRGYQINGHEDADQWDVVCIPQERLA